MSHTNRSPVESTVHCWHVLNSTTNGMGTRGWEIVICCRCGLKGRRDWHFIHDPKHGPHVEDSVVVYQLVKPVEPK